VRKVWGKVRWLELRFFVEGALLVNLESREFSASSDLARLGGGFKTASDRSAPAIGP
jgi:hypothetical protein